MPAVVPNPRPSLSILGVVSWDELHVLERLPPEGGWTNIIETRFAPGGTTGNLAVTANTLGASVRLFTKIGDDERGRQILEGLDLVGIDRTHCIVVPGETDLSIVLVSAETAERTILWKQGPHLELGDRIDIDTLFSADLTVIDCVDLSLRRFLTDLPAHTRPGARLLGTLSYLADTDALDKVEIALRHDILIGNEREYRLLMNTVDGESGLFEVQRRLAGSNTRIAIMTQGGHGAIAVTRDARFSAPAAPSKAVDTTGAGDAFAGALAFAQALRWDIDRSLQLANRVAGLVVSGVGAQEPLLNIGSYLSVESPAS